MQDRRATGSGVRRRRGARAALLVLLLTGAASAQPGSVREQPTSDSSAATGAGDRSPLRQALGSALQPGQGRGDFEFTMDVAALHPGGAGHTLTRVLVQLPVLAFLDLTRADRADLLLRLRVYEAQAALRALEEHGEDSPDTTADERAEYEQADAEMQELLGRFDDVPQTAQAETRSGVQVSSRAQLLDTDFQNFELTVEVPPGDYVFEVLAQNLSRSKRGLLDRLRKRRMASTGRLLVRVPDLAREPALADPVFRSGHVTHADYASRLYGLLNDSLHVATTVFGHGSYDVHVLAHDRSGETHWRDSLRVQVAGRLPIELRTSVNTMPAGQYVLQVTVQGPQGSVSTSRGFDIAWSLVTWQKSRRDLDLEAEIVLTEQEFEHYHTLPVGEKERFMESFWQGHDPTPDTAHNEALEEFHRRVAHADLNFSESGRGSLSDRGKVYVRFGPPTELQAEAIPKHLAGRGAEQALDKVDDAYVASEHEDPEALGSTKGNTPWEQAVRRQEHSRLIGPGNEVVSYELWLYAGAGAPLMPEDRNLAVDSSLRILFVDLEGYGRYRLRKSSVRLDIHGLGTNY